MKNALKNYSDALEAHLIAQKNETVAKDTLKRTRYAVILAREEVRAMEREILEDDMRDL